MPGYHGPCKAPGEHRPPGCVRGRMKRACPFDAPSPPADPQPVRSSPRCYRNDADQASTSYDSAGAYCYVKAAQDEASRRTSGTSSYSTPRVVPPECVRQQLDCPRQQQQQRSASTPCLRRLVSLEIPAHDAFGRARNAASGSHLRPRGAGRKFAAASLRQNPSRPPRCNLAALAEESGKACGSGGESSDRAAQSGPTGEHCQLTNLRIALNDKEMQLVELRDQHVELVNRSAEARENYEEAIRCKDNVIQQLQEVINGKRAMFCREQEALQRTLRQQRTELEKKDRELAALQPKISHQVQELLEQQRTIENLNNQLFSQEKERTNQSNCLFLELEEMSGRLQELETRLQDKKEVIESQRNCCQELKSLVWRQECRIAQLQLSEQQLQSNLAKKNSAIEDLEYSRQQLEIDKCAAEKTICELRRELASLDAAACENAQVLKQREECREECISRLQCEIAELRTELDAKEVALESELGGQRRLEQEHQKMLEEYDCLRVQYDHIKSEHDHFKSECERFRDEHHDLKVQCDLMRNQVETLDFKQQQLDAARCQNEQMRLNLKTAQERLTALQLSISEAERTACLKRSSCMDVYTNELYENDHSLLSPSKCVHHSPRPKVSEEGDTHLPACPLLSKPCPTPVLCSPKTCPAVSKPCTSPRLCSPKPCPALSKPCPVLTKPSPPCLASVKGGPHSKPGLKSTKYGQCVKMTKTTTPRGKAAEALACRKLEAEQKRLKHVDLASSSKQHPWPCRKLETKRDSSPSRTCHISPQRSRDGSRSHSREASPCRLRSCVSRKLETRNVGLSSGMKHGSSGSAQPEVCPVCDKQVELSFSKQGPYYKRSGPTCCCTLRHESLPDCSSDQELKDLEEEIFNRERGWRHTEAKMRAELCRRLDQIHEAHYQNNACKRSYARSYIQSQANKSNQRPQCILQRNKASHCPCPS